MDMKTADIFHCHAICALKNIRIALAKQSIEFAWVLAVNIRGLLSGIPGSGGLEPFRRQESGVSRRFPHGSSYLPSTDFSRGGVSLRTVQTIAVQNPIG
jgi:hypothetical protein